MLYKLYGVPLSQPTRSVIWTLLQLKEKFQLILTVPGATNKIGTQHESFLNKTYSRTGLIPVLEVPIVEPLSSSSSSSLSSSSSWFIEQSPAILMYLCEKNNKHSSITSSTTSNNTMHTTTTPSLYALPTTIEKTRIDAYMHWHHQDGIRQLAQLVRPILRPESSTTTSTTTAPNSTLVISDVVRNHCHQILQSLDQGWLQQQQVQVQIQQPAATDGGAAVRGVSYISGNTSHPSIADLLAYEEIYQTMTIGTWDYAGLQIDNYPNIQQWMKQLQQLPYHEEVHASLTTLGSLVNTTTSSSSSSSSSTDGSTTTSSESNSPIPSTASTLNMKLAAANKAGIQAIIKAQSTY